MSMKKAYFFVLLIIVLLTSCVHTEVEVNGNIAGSVREKGTAKAIGGCSISIEPGNNQIYSSEDGSYSFMGLQMGDYTLSASKSGYEILTETITIGAGKTLNHDIMLIQARAPMVSTDSVTNLMANSTTLCGTVVDNGGAAITKRGFYYGIDSTKMSIVYSTESSDSIPSFTYNIVDLEDGKTYYYQSFATNEIGEGKGDLKSFSTKELFAPRVKTSSATNIGTTTATLHGEITDKGNSPISSWGFYIGEEPNPNQKYVCDLNNNLTLDYLIINLNIKTTYYYCMFAENIKGESKGDIVCFSTLDTSKPKVETDEALNITTSSATLYATIYDNGGLDIKEYGFYFGKSPSSLEKYKIGNLHNNVFSYELKDLEDGNTFYYQAYAINEKGETKGLLKSFSTIAYSVPIVDVYQASNVTAHGATISAQIIDNGGLDIIEKGIYYGISEQQMLKLPINSSGDNIICELSDLLYGTIYLYRAYAINNKGEGISSLYRFSTTTLYKPEVTTSPATDIGYNNATLHGIITNNGGTDILEYGFYYGITTDTDDMKKNKVGNGNATTFNCTITNLDDSTIYYFKSYAINEKGETQGDLLSLQTLYDKYHGHEFVDLGLPSKTLWATMNVGATSVEQYGIYFQWAGTIGGDEGNPGQYVDEHINGTKYDAATQNWGGNWSMPTLKQYEELDTYCTSVDSRVNGVVGTKYTSRNNGNSIFFPHAGYYYMGETTITAEGSGRLYWTATYYDYFAGATGRAYYWKIGGYSSDASGISKNSRLPIRAVTK